MEATAKQAKQSQMRWEGIGRDNGKGNGIQAKRSKTRREPRKASRKPYAPTYEGCTCAGLPPGAQRRHLELGPALGALHCEQVYFLAEERVRAWLWLGHGAIPSGIGAGSYSG